MVVMSSSRSSRKRARDLNAAERESSANDSDHEEDGLPLSKNAKLYRKANRHWEREDAKLRSSKRRRKRAVMYLLVAERREKERKQQASKDAGEEVVTPKEEDVEEDTEAQEAKIVELEGELEELEAKKHKLFLLLKEVLMEEEKKKREERMREAEEQQRLMAESGDSTSLLPHHHTSNSNVIQPISLHAAPSHPHLPVHAHHHHPIHPQARSHSHSHPHTQMMGVSATSGTHTHMNPRNPHHPGGVAMPTATTPTGIAAGSAMARVTNMGRRGTGRGRGMLISESPSTSSQDGHTYGHRLNSGGSGSGARASSPTPQRPSYYQQQQQRTQFGGNASGVSSPTTRYGRDRYVDSSSTPMSDGLLQSPSSRWGGSASPSPAQSPAVTASPSAASSMPGSPSSASSSTAGGLNRFSINRYRGSTTPIATFNSPPVGSAATTGGNATAAGRGRGRMASYAMSRPSYGISRGMSLMESGPSMRSPRDHRSGWDAGGPPRHRQRPSILSGMSGSGTGRGYHHQGDPVYSGGQGGTGGGLLNPNTSSPMTFQARGNRGRGGGLLSPPRHHYGSPHYHPYAPPAHIGGVASSTPQSSYSNAAPSTSSNASSSAGGGDMSTQSGRGGGYPPSYRGRGDQWHGNRW